MNKEWGMKNREQRMKNDAKSFFSFPERGGAYEPWTFTYVRFKLKVGDKNSSQV